MAILTITQLNRYVAFRLKEDAAINGILVRGEISNFVRNSRSGHCYFTLKDAESSVRAVLFRSMAQRLRFQPRDGMHVIAAASASLYERDGAFQLSVTDMQQDGIGQQQEALRQLQKKLSDLGVFAPESKRKLPFLPKKIGAVTSASGAAIRDIQQVLQRRYPLGTLQLFPAQVQGEAAPDSICRALAAAQRAGCDVILLGRGGGSAEDLGAFNTEQVIMAVYHCTVPVISAVGHETDTTLTDAAADLRAPTPSAAAELAAPSKEMLRQLLREKQQTLEKLLKQRLVVLQQELTRQQQRLSATTPQQRQALAAQQLTGFQKRLQQAIAVQLQRKHHALSQELVHLEALSPLKILSRGYALVYREDHLVQDAAAVQPGDHLTIHLASGDLRVQVLEHGRKEHNDI